MTVVHVIDRCLLFSFIVSGVCIIEHIEYHYKHVNALLPFL